MTREEAVKYFKRHLDLYCVDGISREAEEMAIQALEQPTVCDIEQIRAEIERLHYHPKLDFIKNDEVVEMALDIIDHYR